MSECLSAVGRRSHTRALVGCGRWKSFGPDYPSHYLWSTPAESGHINSPAQTPDTCPEAVKRLSQRTLPLAGCSVSPRLSSSGYSCTRRLSQDTPGRGRTIPVV